MKLTLLKTTVHEKLIYNSVEELARSICDIFPTCEGCPLRKSTSYSRVCLANLLSRSGVEGYNHTAVQNEIIKRVKEHIESKNATAINHRFLFEIEE